MLLTATRKSVVFVINAGNIYSIVSILDHSSKMVDGLESGYVSTREHVLSLSNVIGYTRVSYMACANVALVEIGSVAHSALQFYRHHFMHYTQLIYRQLCSGIVPNMLAAASACRPLPSPKDCQSLCSNKTERRPDISRRYTASWP